MLYPQFDFQQQRLFQCMQNRNVNQQKQLIVNPHSPLPKTYFQLIEKVGSGGKYQRNLFFIFFLVYMATGTILLANAFMFLNNQYDCQSQGLITSNCKKTVCQIPDKNQREKYYKLNKEGVLSITTQFGPFMCEDEYLLDIIRSAPYFGSFLAFIIFSYVSDNFGIRKTMLISLSVGTIGCILIGLGQNLAMITLGVILAGGGLNASTSGSLYILSETVQSYKRQKYSTLIQCAYNLGAITLTLFYYVFRQWRIVSILLQIVPAAGLLFIFGFYVEQTPLFKIIKKDQSIKSSNIIIFLHFFLFQYRFSHQICRYLQFLLKLISIIQDLQTFQKYLLQFQFKKQLIYANDALINIERQK